MNRYGSAVSMGDVASEAGLSRGSVYRHFGDRDALVTAVLARTADRFLASAAARVDRRRTLSGQFAEAITLVANRARDVDAESGGAPASARRDTPLALVLVRDTSSMAPRWMEFWAQRLDAAKARGEVRADLDGRVAAEWLARMLLSFAVAPEVEVDPDDHRAVRRFVDHHLLQGLAA